MFHKILAAIDVPPMSRCVFDCALSLAKMFHANLGLLYIFTPDQYEALPDSKLDMLTPYGEETTGAGSCYIGHLLPEHLNAMDNPTYNLLRSYTHQASIQGVNSEFFQCVGAPGAAICDFAKAWQADLIVVGYKGRHGLTELLLGSVSSYVVHHAPCSVHVIRHPIYTHHACLEKSEAIASR